MIGGGRLVIACAVAVTVAATVPAAGLADESGSVFEACMSNARSNADYSACGQAEIDRQETILNATWRALARSMQEFDANAFKALLDEQRLWIKLKESSCIYYRNGFGREGYVVNYPACMIEVLKSRIAYLSAIEHEVGLR